MLTAYAVRHETCALKKYSAPDNFIKKLASLHLESDQAQFSLALVTTLHDLVVNSLQGTTFLVSWFFDQAIDFTEIRLEGDLMKNGYYGVTMMDEITLAHAWVHANCIVLFWRGSQAENLFRIQRALSMM